MLKRAAIFLAILVPVTWLAASLFVALYVPADEVNTTLRLEIQDDGQRRWVLATPGQDSWFVQRGSATFGTGSRFKRAYDHLLVRGRVDAASGTIPAAAGCAYRDWARLREVRLEASSDAAWTEEETDWTLLASARPERSGRWQTVLLEGDAPADTVAVQVVCRTEDGQEWSAGRTLARPHDELERLLEDLAAHGVFRWLAPDEAR